jgi:hypothetical protein
MIQALKGRNNPKLYFALSGLVVFHHLLPGAMRRAIGLCPFGAFQSRCYCKALLLLVTIDFSKYSKYLFSVFPLKLIGAIQTEQVAS